MKKRDMDRRTFVMGSFGFGMAVLGGGMLAGCAAGDEPAAPEAPEPVAAPETPEPAAAPEPKAGGGRALVAVFSYSGTTLTVAERIAEATGADLFRIETTDAWPDDYDAMTAQVQREQDEGYLPPLAAAVQDWDAYDTVYLGHPIWWGQLPHVVRSFLAQHDLAQNGGPVLHEQLERQRSRPRRPARAVPRSRCARSPASHARQPSRRA